MALPERSWKLIAVVLLGLVQQLRGFRPSRLLHHHHHHHQHLHLRGATGRRSRRLLHADVRSTSAADSNFYADADGRDDDEREDDEILARVVAVGDIHGDLDAGVKALRLGGLIAGEPRSGNTTWVGGATTLVVCGDVLDRGDEELELMALLADLRVQAAVAGGRVVCLLGNHEVMNAAGDFRYATPGGTRGIAQALEQCVLRELGGVWGRRWVSVKPLELRARAAAFAPGGVLAREMAAHYLVAATVHGTLFTHGALTVDALRAVPLAEGGAAAAAAAAAAEGEEEEGGEEEEEVEECAAALESDLLDALSCPPPAQWYQNPPPPLALPRAIWNMNRRASAWLSGRSGEAPRELFGPRSLVWNRQYGAPVGFEMSDADEADLGALLDEIGCARAVVSVLAAVPRSCLVSVVALQNQKFRPTHPRMNPPSLINQTNRTAWLADRAHAAAAAAAGSARLRRLRHQRRGGGALLARGHGHVPHDGRALRGPRAPALPPRRRRRAAHHRPHGGGPHPRRGARRVGRLRRQRGHQGRARR